MTLRDLGYRPYDGPRMPPSSTTWVMYRYGIRRALDSTLLKLLLGVAILPAFVIPLMARIVLTFARDGEFEFASYVSSALALQTWFFVGIAGLLVGSTAISEDLQARAFPFFFAKPLTPLQYLTGRVLAIATLVFALVFVPCAIVVVGFAGAAPVEMRAESAGYLLPVLAESLLVAVVVSTTSVALSATTRNRAITMSLWVVLWIVPKVIAAVVRLAVGSAWLDLTSIPGLLGIVGDALLQQSDPAMLPWHWGLLALVTYSIASVVFALSRLERAEVIA